MLARCFINPSMHCQIGMLTPLDYGVNPVVCCLLYINVPLTVQLMLSLFSCFVRIVLSIHNRVSDIMIVNLLCVYLAVMMCLE